MIQFIYKIVLRVWKQIEEYGIKTNTVICSCFSSIGIVHKLENSRLVDDIIHIDKHFIQLISLCTILFPNKLCLFFKYENSLVYSKKNLIKNMPTRIEIFNRLYVYLIHLVFLWWVMNTFDNQISLYTWKAVWTL